MTPVDLDALRRCVKWAEGYQKREPQIAVLPHPMPRADSDDWVRIATRLVSVAQSTNLHLQPWQCAPIDTCDDGDVDDDCYGRRRSEVTLRQRMVAAGVSIFEPDPERALAEAEHAA
jgi:hypothetical protein